MGLYARLLQVLGLLAGAIFAAIAVTTAIDVTLRNLFGGGIRGLLELVEYGLYVATFLAAPWVLHRGGHVRVDFLVAASPPRTARSMRLAADAIGLGVSLVLVYYSVRVAMASHAQGNLILKTVIFPEWWLYALIPFTTLLLAAEFARRLVVREYAAGDRAEL